MRPRGLAAGAVLAALLAACSPGAQEQPDVIAKRDVPFQLLDTTSTSTHASEPDDAAPDFSIYLVAGERLVALPRSSNGAPPSPGTALHALLEGATDVEDQVGITSAIPNGTRILRLTRSGPELGIDLARGIITPAADETLAVGQLVLTATSLAGIEQVRFRVDGTTVQVPTGDGTLAEGAVTRAQYEELLG